MIKFLFAVFLALVSVVCSAQTQTSYYAVAVSGTNYGPKPTAAEICPLLDGKFSVTGYTRYAAPGYRNLACYQQFKKNTDGTISDFFLAAPSQYSCNAGPFPSTGCAPPPPTCPKDLVVGMSQDYATKDKMINTPYPTCFNSCSVTVTSLDMCWTYKVAGKGFGTCDFTGTYTGTVCAQSDATGSQPAPDADTAQGTSSAPQKAPNAVACPAGTVQAGMSADGVPLCVGTGTKPMTASSDKTTVKPETTTTNADGSSVKTQVTEVTNADGSVTTTTKTTTTAADGTTTVSVKGSTGTTPTGEAGKPGTNGTNGANGEDAKNLCQTNPELSMCKNSTVSGGCDAATGSATVACTGDAIQCATLQKAAVIACKQQKDDADLKASALFAKGSAVAGGSDPDGSTLPSPANASSVAMPSSLNTTGFVGGGSPFSDVTFSVQGRSFTIPFAKWTGYLEAFKYVLMVIASLVSFRMLSGAILKDS